MLECIITPAGVNFSRQKKVAGISSDGNYLLRIVKKKNLQKSLSLEIPKKLPAVSQNVAQNLLFATFESRKLLKSCHPTPPPLPKLK